jgi:hypothetical protein
MNLAYVFDVETTALPDHELEFNEPKIRSDIKDPAKIEARIQEAKNKQIERAALDPLTGKIVALGILGPTRDDVSLLFGPEPEMITRFFDYFYLDASVPWIGFNIEQFDLPFILRRAWHHGITPPGLFYNGRYMPGNFVDLFKLWRLYNWKDENISLNRLGKFLGLGGKENSGAAFAQLLYASEAKAREYLQHDLELTWDCAIRMGVIGQQDGIKTPLEATSIDPEAIDEPDDISMW